MSSGKLLVMSILLISSTAWPRQASSPAAGKADAATIKRDSARCSGHADIDACYDAIRWNPGDPALLVALGDALMRAHRPADAARNYRRAAALAPTMRGIAAKVSAAEARLVSKHAPKGPSTDPGSRNGPPGKRYSNAAPEAQSH